ncbi:MAG: DJ-1/PfpI family protein [Promethearchaeota archaeon]
MINYKIVFLLSLLTLSCCVGITPFQVSSQTINDVHVLFIVSDGFGWSYFTAQDYFDAWGVQTTTIALALDTTVSACHNRPPREIIADMLIQNFDVNTLSTYDCVFIPAGGNWPSLIASLTIRDLIANAHAQGLIVATFCIGNVVVASAGSICAGTKVASFSMSNDEMLTAGANIVENVRLVYDNRIITGSQGGGPTGGGYDVAPIYEACAMVVKAALHQSYAESVNITPTGADYTISVITTDPASTLPGINSTAINTVRAQVYSTANPITPVSTLNLVGSGNTYTGAISGLTGGPYRIDVEVRDTDDVLEVIRNVATVFPSLPLVLGAVIGVIAVIAAITGLVYWKRRSIPSE